MRVLEAKTDGIIRLLRRLETLDHKTDRVLELLEGQLADVAARGVCQNPVSDVTSGDVLVTGDVPDVMCSVSELTGEFKVEEGDFTAMGDVRSPEDVIAVSAQGDVAETDITVGIETTTPVTGNITTNAGDAPPIAGDIIVISGDIAAASDEDAASSDNLLLQAGNNSHLWHSHLLMGLRKACSLLETRTAATAEDMELLMQLRGEFCWVRPDD